MDPIKIPLRQLEASDNADALLTEEQSNQIGSDVVKAYLEDKESRKEWEDRTEEAMKLALQVIEVKNTPWPNASNVKFPLVTIAALQFAARAYPALVKAPDVARYRVMGEDKDGQKAARAERIGRHMSWQLLDQDETWEEDADRSYFVTAIIGCAFKKTYWDAGKQQSCSRLVLPQNLVVNYFARSIEEAERKTEVFDLHEREIKERVLKGLYSKKELGQPQAKEVPLSDTRQGVTPPPVTSATPRVLLEQHCYLDLDGDDYPEPYVVTVDKSSSKVLRIKSRFGEVTTEQSVQAKKLLDQRKMVAIQAQGMQEQAEAAMQQLIASNTQQGQQPDPALVQRAQDAMQQHLQQSAAPLQQQADQLDAQIKQVQSEDQSNPSVLSILALEYYTKQGFIPAPDGGFYDLGLYALLGAMNSSVNTLINQLIDSGTLQNGSQGFIGKGARIQGGEVRFKPYEWKRVNVAGQALRDSLVPLPVNQPSNVLFQLLSLLINYSEKVSSVNDAMTGENPGQNTPAFNMQSMLEQGLQVFNGIFKRLYRSFRKELRKLYVLNRIYLNQIEYYETLDGNFKALQNDYTADEKDVLPASDPDAFSSQQKMMKAQMLAQRASMVPGYNMAGVEKRILQAADIPDTQDVYPVDEKGQPVIQPPPNPEAQLAAAEEQRRTMEAHDKAQVAYAIANSQIAVNESIVLVNQYKAQAIGAEALISEFQAISDRQKADAATMAAEAAKASARAKPAAD